MRKLTFGSLFTGMGGMDEGLEMAGFNVRWQAEYIIQRQAWLKLRWPEVPLYGDVTDVDFSTVEPVDLICGGFPCQGNSVAGKRKGRADKRWLWPYFATAIRCLRPRYVLIENVPGLLTVDNGAAFGEVLADLSALRYEYEWAVISAASVGAPHLRERLFVVAYTDRYRTGERHGSDAFGRDIGEVLERGDCPRPEDPRSDALQGSTAMGDAGSAGRQQVTGSPSRDEGEVRTQGGDLAPGAVTAMGDADLSGSGRIAQPARGDQPHGDDAGREEEAGRAIERSEDVGDTDSPREQQPQGAVGGVGRRTADPGTSLGDAASLRCDRDQAESRGEGTPAEEGRPKRDAAPRHGEPAGAVARYGRIFDRPPVRSTFWKDGIVVAGRVVKPGTCPVDDGLPGRSARLAAVGDAVVPQVAEYVGGCILRLHERLESGFYG